MKIRSILLTGVLVVSMSSSVVFAGEAAAEAPAESGGAVKEILGSLFGKGGPLEDVLPEGTDINQMVDGAKEQLAQAGVEVSGVVGDLIDKAQEELGDLDLDSLGKYAESILDEFMEEGNFDLNSLGESAESILGMLMGGDGLDFDDEEFAAVLEVFSSIHDTQEEYIKAYNAERMDVGEIQVVCMDNIYVDEFEQDDVRTLADLIQYNYNKNENGQLVLVSSAESVVLFRHRKDAEGKYPIQEAVFAEEGDKFEQSVETFCAELELDPQETLDSIDFSRMLSIYDLINYLDENPEITGIEYEGEIRTSEELHEIADARIDAFLAEMDADELAEEAMTGDAATENAAAGDVGKENAG